MCGKAGHRFVLHRILPTAARRRFLFREIRCPRAFLSKAQLYELKKVKVLCDAKRRRVSVSVDRQRNEFLTRHLHITTRYDALRRHRLAYFQSHQSSLHRRSTFENIGENCHVKINFTYKILCVRAHKLNFVFYKVFKKQQTEYIYAVFSNAIIWLTKYYFNPR